MKKTFVLFILTSMLVLTLGFVSACHCGDGIKNQAWEQCDKGILNGQVCTPLYGSSCTYCSAPVIGVPRSGCQNITLQGGYCGDGIIQTPEECDDGNQVDGDGCTANCTTEPPQVPEFGTIVGILTVLGALGMFFVVRKN